jgi:hypothetical protein
MPLSGAWLASAKQPAPDQSLRHQVAATHAQIGNPDEPNGPVTTQYWQAPEYQSAPAGSSYVGMEYTDGTLGATYPKQAGHDQSLGHSNDDGYLRQRTTGISNQFADEKYYDATAQGQPGGVSTISMEARNRGMNAEAENNPPDESYGGEGFRRGWWRRSNIERRFSPPFRTHDLRMVGANTATVIADSPPPDNPSSMNSPFSALARIRRNNYAVPQMRRIPPAWDDAVITDGSESIAMGPQPMVGGEWLY